MFSCIIGTRKKEHHQYINPEDFMNYMDVLLHGTEKEKLQQSFLLLDVRGNGKVYYKDFLSVAGNVTRMWSAAYGKPVEMEEEVIKKVFNTISNNKKSFQAKNYIKVVEKHPDLMTWLTKPKELIDCKFEKKISKKEQSYSSEIVEMIIRDSTSFVDEVINSLEKVTKIFNGSKDFDRKRYRSYSMHSGKAPLQRDESIKLQDIVKKDFVLNESAPRTSTLTKSFIPGVQRKQLVMRKSTEKKTSNDYPDDISSQLKQTPKPSCMHFQDEEELEGGSSEESESSMTKKSSHSHNIKLKSKASKKKSRKRKYEVEEDLDSSGDCSSDLRLKKKDLEYNLPGSLFKPNINESIIDEIPFSAFESSSSSGSENTFESYYEGEELARELRDYRVPINVEEFEENKTYNAGEIAMISLSDIPLEIDQGFSDRRSEHTGIFENAENGKTRKYDRTILSHEKEVKLQDDCSDNQSYLAPKTAKTAKARTGLKLKNYDTSMKSLGTKNIENLEAEMYIENRITELENKIFSDEKHVMNDHSRIRNFMKEYISNESKIMDAKLVLDELIQTSIDFKTKLKETVDQEDEKIEANNKKEKQMMDRVKSNIHKGRSTVLRNKRANQIKSMSMVHPGHENFNLVFNIMLGVKKAIDAVIDFPMFEIQKKDFKIKCVYEIAPWRTTDDDNLKACSFMDYAPQIFDSIRKKFNVRKEEYSRSLGPDQILTNLLTGDMNTLAELCSSGKSGSFFYYTADGKYMLKTISKNEFKFFKRILRNYYKHIEGNDNTMITRIYGLHKMIFFRKNRKTEKTLFFCIMNNVFNTNKEIHRRYDLKGSTQGRTTKYANDRFDPTIALKDNDIVEENGYFIVDEEVRDKLHDQINRDVKFFKENNIIDYSLLIGIHDRTLKSNFPPSRSIRDSNMSDSCENLYYSDKQINNIDTPFYEQNEGGMYNHNNSKIYFCGVIDILTEYNTKKKLEHFFKSIKYGNKIS